MLPVLNALDLIRSIPTARRFDIGNLHFAQFACPPQDGTACLWSETDHLVHVLSGVSTWRTPGRSWEITAGETVFFKKGAYFAPPHHEADLCLLVFFVPDSFVHETVRELATELSQAPWQQAEPFRHVARVSNDLAVTAFIHAMTDYFSSREQPPAPLLKLKLKELIVGILVGSGNRSLSDYFRLLASRRVPDIASIMETNFWHNLPLESFAQMCHRSLSSFKRAFRHHYGTSPGRWLLNRRLALSMNLLRTTNLSVTEIMLESGFEDPSHFSHAFRGKFGQPPSACRASAVSVSDGTSD
jgi:AraC-like DNA-binding protein